MPDFDMQSLTTMAKDTLIDGAVGAGGLYLYGNFIGPQFVRFLGPTVGKWTNPVGAFITGLLYRWIGSKVGHEEIGRSAAATVFGSKLVAAFAPGTDPPARMAGTVIGGGQPETMVSFTGLSPVVLEHRVT